MEAEPAGDGRAFGARDLDARRQPPEHRHEEDAGGGISKHDRAVGVDAADAAAAQHLDGQPGHQRAGGHRERADEVVPGEDAGPRGVRDEPGQRRLLDGQEWSDLAAARADDADDRGDDEDRHEGRRREYDRGAAHEDGAEDEDASTAEAIGMGGQPQRDERVTDERQEQQQADRRAIEAEPVEVQDEHQREGAVGEHPEGPGGEQPAAI